MNLSTDAGRLLAAVMARVFTPRPPLTVDQWADRSRRLTGEAAAEPGAWNTNRAPYTRHPMRACTNPDVDEISLCWASQTGKTEVIINWTGWICAMDPAPMMWFWPNEDLAGEFCQDRLLPAINASPDWKRLIGERPRDQKVAKIIFRVAGCTLYLKGAGSDAQGKSKPIKYPICDEIDSEQFAPGMIQHARQRMAAWPGGKFIKASIPSFEGIGIDGELARSSCHFYHVPCPHCGEYQRLVWKGVQWDGDATSKNMDRAERTARYACSHCGAEIHDHHKPWMLSLGLWACGDTASVRKLDADARLDQLLAAERDPNHERGIDIPDGYEVVGEPSPGEKGRHWGYQLSAIYSPWVSFGSLARGWCEHNGTPPREWINGVLAEAWRATGDRVDADQIIRQCLPVDSRSPESEKATRGEGAYRLGELPAGVLVLTGGIDLQRDRAYYTIRGWGERCRSSWLLWFGVVKAPHGDEVATRESLATVINRIIGTTPETMVGVSRWAIDSGDGVRTAEVYRFAREYPGRVFACKGQSGDMMLASRKTKLDKYPNGKPIPGGLVLLNVNTWKYKGVLLGKMRQAPPPTGAGAVRAALHEDTEGSGRWWWPDPYLDCEGREIRDDLVDYFEQITAEQLVIVNERAVTRGAKPEYEWKLRPKRTDNHFLDAEVYAAGVAESEFGGITRAKVDAIKAKAATGQERKPPEPPTPSGRRLNDLRAEFRERHGR